MGVCPVDEIPFPTCLAHHLEPLTCFPAERLGLAVPWLLTVAICIQDMQEHHSIAYNVEMLNKLSRTRDDL